MSSPMARASDGQTYLLVATPGLDMAIPVRDVDRVLPAPERLDAMPRIDARVEGMMGLEGMPLPVTSIARWSGAANPSLSVPSVPSSVCVLAHGARRLGLLVNRPLRTLRAPASAASRMLHESKAGEIFDHVLTENDSRWPILAVDRLMDVSNAWASASTTRQSAANAGTVQGTRPRRGVVFRLGEHPFVVPVERVLAAAPIPAVQPVGVAPGLLGAITWRARTTALICPLPDATSRRVPDGGLMLLVRGLRGCASEREESLLAIAIDAVDRIHCLAQEGAATRDEAQVPGAGAWPRALLEDGRVVSVLDVDRLAGAYAFEWFPVDARPATREASGASRDVDAASYVVYERGVTWAVELSKVQEILRVPPAFLDPDATHPAEVSWRGRLIPVIGSINVAGARAAPTGEERLLVILGDDGCVGLLADSVRHLLPGRAARRSRVGLPQVGVVDVVTASIGGVQETFRVMCTTTDAVRSMRLPRGEAFNDQQQQASRKC